MDRQETNHRERVDVAEGPEPAVADETPPAWLTIGQRLAAIRDECNGIKKDSISKEKDGKKWTEKGHIVEVILSEFRPLLSKYEVDMTPNLVERTYQGNRCDVVVDFTFEVLTLPFYGEMPPERDLIRIVRWAGAGTDNGDKAFAKAGTNALKELVKKLFLVTDRDDAKEETESVDHRTDEGISRGALEKATEQRRAAIEMWAKAFKMGLEKASDLKDVQRLERENKDQLISEDLPEVTRTFFIELIQARRAALA